jgi:hypothetical protein
VNETPFDRVAVRRGAIAALWAIALLGIAAFPSRLGGALKGWGSLTTRTERALAGTWLDLAAGLLVLAPFMVLLGLLAPLLLRPLRRAGWQRWGGLVATLPLGFALWVFTVTAQEVKSERGSFPTMFDLSEGGTNASFIEGMVGFLAYDRIRTPAIVGIALALALIVGALRRRPADAVAWRSWSTGYVLGLLATSAVVIGGQNAMAQINRFSPAALGDPLTGLIESSLDLLQHRGPSSARDLILEAQLPADAAARGARLAGWPVSDGGCEPLPFARPLDRDLEPPTPNPRGTALVKSFEALSRALFTDDDPKLAVFFVSLEGFRADDIHALNPQAPRAIAPFTTALYERAGRSGEGVLASRKMIQAGVRTAHNLGAMTCGLGTLPYNLAFVRDLQPFRVRCASDVLADAGFRHSFFYGSDATFDEMHHFFAQHRFVEQISQVELPKNLPKGTWDGVTDFAVFDFSVTRIAETLKATGTPQFAFLMSLSNHSPFTTPQDLPSEVPARVEAAIQSVRNRADPDDQKRLVAFSYTDAAVGRLFSKLDAVGIAERSIVVLMADHSTGHSYVWGAESTETDAQKSQVPFAIVIPPSFRARLANPAMFDAAVTDAQAQLDSGAVSLNDVPTLTLALLSAQPNVKALAADRRWHTLGGQLTSPWFDAGEGAALISINGVSELFATDAHGERLGGYEDSVFLKTRADRYRVTPRLIPLAATLQQVMRCVPAP